VATVEIDPSSETYGQFAKLYRIARRQFPSAVDRWNGKLCATVGEGRNWGSLQRDGSFKLSKELVLDRLAAGTPPHKQVQALTTVLHESLHARVEVDAPLEPNAVPSQHSQALDEGLTEWVAVDGVAVFADEAGYGQLPDAVPEYSQVYCATELLLEYAAGTDRAQELADRAIDAPVVMRWDVIADEIVKNHLGTTVPPDPLHRQAARAELIQAMTRPEWLDVHQTQANVGAAVAQETTQAIGAAADRIREHYLQNPGTPYPAENPNFRVARSAYQHVGGPQERMVSHGELRFLTGTAPASGATSQRPELRDGERAAGRAAVPLGKAVAGPDSRGSGSAGG